ncbi:hypothetical protein ACFP1L_11840 [Lactiplantibacillus nangangensis]|uniref:Holin n=1 Tax=Lactiplantibacillus nangangensis TaxID=2559917 RepID=A0ABW1SMQ1_9LACO|nr:hypothetical protein [Lactiplantibacillus nangangensis]
MTKFKFSFNKKSPTDIASVVFIIASGLVTLGTALGFTLPGSTSDSINAWVSVVTLIVGNLGLSINTEHVGKNGGTGSDQQTQK